MAEDDFFVAGIKFETVVLNKDRVHHLFGVTVSVTRTVNYDGVQEDRLENTKVHLSSSTGTLSSKKKAQTYLQAILEEGEDFWKERLTFKPKDFNMVLSEYDLIEQLSQAVLKYFPEKNIISIQGSLKNVEFARNHINRLTETTPMSNDIVSDSENVHTEYITIPLAKLSLKESNSNSLRARGSPVQYVDVHKHSAAFEPDDHLENDSYLFGNPTELKQSDLNVSSNSSCSSPEKETERILLDPEYSNQVVKALKLGYSNEQIAAVLKKLGTTAASVDPNTLLSELIKQEAMTPDLTTDSVPTLFSSDTDSSIAADDNSPATDVENADSPSNLKHIVIDGSNVAMSHGNKEVFSCRGILLAVDYFRNRGHNKITVFVPQWRKESSRPDAQIKDQEVIKELEKEKIVVFTPSRRIAGKRVVCYDDRFILDLASDKNGIVVSNDNYRDLHNEKSQYKKVAEEQLLQYVFVGDKFMPPEDPLGKHGPTLGNFLRIKPVVSEPLKACPYGKKCTYGNKCRFSHPERGNKPHRSVTDILLEQSNKKLKDRDVKLEGLRKKDLTKKKQILRRTQSLYPDDSRLLTKSESIADDRISQNTWDSDKPDMNDKLDKYRRKMDETVRQSREASPVPTVEVQRAPGSIPRSTLVNNESLVRELKPFDSARLQTSSPLPTGSQQGLVSGHLSLAKKLSDPPDTSFFESAKAQLPQLATDQQQQQQQQRNSFQGGMQSTYSDQVVPNENSMPSAYEYCYSEPLYTRPTMYHSNEERYRSYPLTQPGAHFGYQSNMWESTPQSSAGFEDPNYSSDRMSAVSNRLQDNPIMRQNSFSDSQIYMAPPSSYRGQELDRNLQNGRLIQRSSSIQPLPNSQRSSMMRQYSEMPYSHTSGFLPSHHPSFGPGEVGNYVTPVQNMWTSGQPIQQQVMSPYTQPPAFAAYSQHPPPPVQAASHPQIVSDAEITPSDPRYVLYYSICNLFPERKVRTVMNENPNERDPSVLCAYIIGMK